MCEGGGATAHAFASGVQSYRVEWKALKAACAHVQDVIDAGANSHFIQFITELGRIIESGDQRGFYKNLKGTVGMEETTVK